jgi:hypothetical protein
MDPNVVLAIGALAFGFVVGWITYRTLRRITDTKISDLAAVLGAVGGAAVTGLFKPGGAEFGWYCIGLFAGFFLYFRIALRNDAPDWLGTAPRLQGSEQVVMPRSQQQGPSGPVFPPPPPPPPSIRQPVAPAPTSGASQPVVPPPPAPAIGLRVRRTG